ncbi:MAG: DNA replication/repair protein RecF [Bacilli bacterium]
MFYIQKIDLHQFRCYKKATFTFGSTKNIIYGDNASGKTSLVEAIHCLGIGKTFKNTKDFDLINKPNHFMSINALISDDQGDNKVLFAYDGRVKQITKNSKSYKRLSEYLGYINVVVFSPDDLELIKGSPSERRRFLDVNIGQIDHIYLESLIRFKKILKERNEYLKNQDQWIEDDVMIRTLDDALIKQSQIIIQKRNDFICELNRCVRLINLQLSSQKEIFEIIYDPNCSVDELVMKAHDRHRYDIAMHQTTWGPSRDDVTFLINSAPASIYCSQGQIRTASLSIKLALADMVKRRGNNMIVILDDVLSELDTSRQNEVLKMLDPDKQTFITTTSIQHISKELLDNSTLIQIRGEKL